MTSLTASDSNAARSGSDNRPDTFLRRVLFIDASTCLGAGAVLSLYASPLAPLLGLPAALLSYAGLSLFPTAAFMLWVALRREILRLGAQIIIAGNLLWIIASIATLTLAPAPLGYAFVIAQAIVVALLAKLELTGLRKSTS
jgi:hypothetical protein